jgi:hypothetical protein
MGADYKESNIPIEAKETPPDEKSGLSDAGRQAMQGVPDSANTPATTDTPPLPEKQIVGTPEQDARFWREQQHPDTCAIAAQEGIIAKHTGHAPGAEALRQEAKQQGWYQEGAGTPPADVGKLLEAHDVPVGFRGSGNMEQLQADLSAGKDVIVGVDAGYLWQDPNYLGEGHAVGVTGVEKGAGNQVSSVFLNDSGNPAIGGGGKVTAVDFQQAWQETNNFMVSTEQAAPKATD